MNRRTFGRMAAGAAGVQALQRVGVTKAAVSTTGRMKLGTQHDSSNETLRTIAALGVTHICARLPSPKFDEQWSVPELSRLRGRVEAVGLTLAAVPLPMSSVYITHAEFPHIMLGKSPERDKEIADVCQMLENCSRAGIAMVKYNLNVLGVPRTARTEGRGGASYSTFRYAEAKQEPPLTEAGPLSDDLMWERITYFLHRVVPVATEYRVRLACHPHDPGMPVDKGFRGVHCVLGSVAGLKRFIEIEPSPYHGLNFCQGTVSEMLADPNREIGDVIRYSARGRRSSTCISVIYTGIFSTSRRPFRTAAMSICSLACAFTRKSGTTVW